MIQNGFDQVPDGMMDRIRERLAEHVSARKKRKKVKTVLIAVTCSLLLPISAYAVINISNDYYWNWYEGIKKAEKSGKTVEINKEFEYKDGKILFKDAVWEDDCLLITYSILEGESVIPANIHLYNEQWEMIQDGSVQGGGSLKIGINSEKLVGDTAYLSISGLDYPEVFHDIPVNWKIPIKVEKIDTEVVSINKEIKLDKGILRINNAVLGPASTKLYYEYIPSVDRQIWDVELGMSMKVNGKKYDCENDDDRANKGKVIFKIPLSKKEFLKAKFYLLITDITEYSGEKIIVEKGKVPFNVNVHGAKFKIEKMEVKDGHTYIDIVVDDTNRDFFDFDLMTLKNGEHLSRHTKSTKELRDKNIEESLKKDPNSVTASDYTNTIIKKSVEIEGEHDKVELMIKSLTYTEVPKYEFTVK